MPSPSRGGGPAAMPKYQRIAAALRHELEHAEHGPGGRLPSERTLAARYRVNRQTVRAALQQLREEGLIVTGRRGTRSAAATQPAGREPAPGGALQAYGVVPAGGALPGYGAASAGGVPPGYGAAPSAVGALPDGRADRADWALAAAAPRGGVDPRIPVDQPDGVDQVLPADRPRGAGQGLPAERHGSAANRAGRVDPAPVAVPPDGAPVPPAAPSAAAAHLPGVVPAPAAVSPQSWLALVTLPPSLGALLGMRGGERTLVHHRRDRGPAGQTLQHAVTYLCPRAVARTPELAGYLDRAAARDEDLGPLHRWLDRAAEQGRVAETLTMTRSSHPPAAASACGLTVRRTLHDHSGRLLAVTDLAFPTWDRLTFHRDRAVGGFRIS
ncbi:GntR family transcriptional regulator [Streptomyces sp. NPDC046876]|uniref:GntR family transcriptional regulator n=1 Tax=Streptomyces sp. NPDC046876 TaxID=3155616 RepID=UPI003403F2F3